MTRPSPRRAGRGTHPVARGESSHVGLKDGDGGHAEVARGMQTAVAQQRRRSQMHDVRVEASQHSRHSQMRNTQRKRRDLREHSRLNPVDTNAVVNASRRSLSARRIRCDDKCFVAGAAKVLQHPQHRIGDSIDVGKERFGDNCDAHDRQRGSGDCRAGCGQRYGTRKAGARRRVCGVGCAAPGVRRRVCGVAFPQCVPLRCALQTSACGRCASSAAHLR